MPISFDEVKDIIREDAEDELSKGKRFESAVAYFLKNDPLWSERFKEVWAWDDAPTNDGQDIGIDLVALDADNGCYWAIQCKFYDEDATLTYKNLSTFFSTAAAKKLYGHYMIVDTANVWSSNLRKVADQYRTVRIDSEDMASSELDWQPFLEGKDTAKRAFQEPRQHQREAIEAAKEGFKTSDRGKLIMACGTGKTLVSLRLAEEMYPEGGMVLFLAPSISLVSQTLRTWANQSKQRLRPFVVCSDNTVSRVEDAWETSASEIPYPSTTSATELVEQFSRKPNQGGMTVVFSTYQSVQVVADAQLQGLPAFDLIICDEAHRTTGVHQLMQTPEEQSSFTKVHNNNIVKGAKRLYMTATPRIYGDKAVKAAREESYVISSMDDEKTYGPEFYYLSFGQAVDEGLLTDYKVVALVVLEEMASSVYQQAMDEEENGFQVPDAAKVIGCLKGLAGKGEDDVPDRRPLRSAVAFHTTIKESERFAENFASITDAYREKSGNAFDLVCETDHVSGAMNSNIRKRKLKWLEEDTSQDGTNTCRILSNARCLAEGVDVPNLDAILFMKPRKSQIDIVQAVGRVMRKYEGKDYGYIFLPIVVPAGVDRSYALDSNEAFSVVWQVLKGLRSHDERLDARINALRFEDADSPLTLEFVPGFGGFESEPTEDGQERLTFTVEEWKEAVNAAVVKKCGTRVYWEDWAEDISKIAVRQIERITQIVAGHDLAGQRFQVFLTGLRDSLNPSISEDEAIEMLSQHIITLPVFEALFEGADFASSNPVSIAMEGMISALREYGLADLHETLELRDLYRSVEIRAASIKTDAGRQNVIKELYEGFFSKAFKATSEKMGIVYTPNEVVDYILYATDRMIRQEFGQSLEDRGVHILDPFTGTGTFLVNLLRSGLISDVKLPYKYAHELHANEILLLAYYIATINIEHAYHSRVPGEYVPFPGAVLTDTFQMTETGDTLDVEVFVENSERVLRQNELPITVIIGNPPYSAGQGSANDNNANTKYPFLDSRIQCRYVDGTKAGLSSAVYDTYIRAFRWATDRIGERGIICYVSNAGWLDGQSFDIFRKSLVEEFNSIYVLNLRGNARTQGEERRKEKDNVFGQGTRTPIAITMLVKNPDSIEHGVIHYYDIGDYLNREDKLSIIRNYTQRFSVGEEDDAIDVIDWASLTPDAHGDWLNQRDGSFYKFLPLNFGDPKKSHGLFCLRTNGLKTQRDAWAYNFAQGNLRNNIFDMLEFYNAELERWKCTKNIAPESFVSNDASSISWTRALRQHFARGEVIGFQEASVVLSSYRPFCKMFLYADNRVNEVSGQWHRLFPAANCENLIISLTNGTACTVLMSNSIVDYEFLHHAQCFPLYWYEKQEPLGGIFAGVEQAAYKKHDAVTVEALAVFQNAYPSIKITKEDIFYYIYGVFHSPEYRSRFAANLAKELPRIPLSRNFANFMKAGRALADLHLNYESIDPWPLQEIGSSIDPGRVTKLRWGKNGKAADKSTIIYNENLVLSGIPEAAHRYIVNGKSALGWILDRYQVKTDKDSGIVNDPNDYSDDPRYIIDLIKRVTRVSVETMEIVDALPGLQELPQPGYWPEAWKSF